MYRQKLRFLTDAGDRQRSRRELQERLAAVSGGPKFARSPGASAADFFRQSFEQIGRARVEQQAQPFAGEKAEPQRADMGLSITEGIRAPVGRAAPERSKGIPSKPLPLQRFSELAFRRGNLAGSILQGTGKMMLVSCLRRTVNPRRPEPHESLKPGEKRTPFSGHDPDAQVFMRDLARGAVSIVVDTLHDARRTMQLLKEAVERGGPGAEELFSMYPFLDDRGERELLAEYHAALPGASDSDICAMLQNAIVHAEASMAEKAKMRMDFLTALRRVTDRARKAIEEFESEGAAEEAARQAVEEELPEEMPPPEDPRKPKRKGPSEDVPVQPEKPRQPERGDPSEEAGHPPEKSQEPDRGEEHEDHRQGRRKERGERMEYPEPGGPPPEIPRGYGREEHTGREAGPRPHGDIGSNREQPVPGRNAAEAAVPAFHGEYERGVYAAGSEPPTFEEPREAALGAVEIAGAAGSRGWLLLALAFLGALGVKKAMERNAQAAKNAEGAKNAAIREAFNRGGDARTAILFASMREGASLRAGAA